MNIMTNENQNKINQNIQININSFNNEGQFNNNIYSNSDKTKILICLILLYGNEQEILRLYSQGVYD